MYSRFFVPLAAALFVAASVGVSTSRADGLPVLGVDAGATGVPAPSDQARYVTIPAGANTVAARVSRHGGRILASSLLPGTFTIPAVAYDGSAGGISGDGRTLVLIKPRDSFPRAQTTLALIETPQLKSRGVIKLRGDFSFDAISVQGTLLYLIQYTSAVDPTRYVVRSYDIAARHLIAAPVVDPHERGEKMRGQPLTRATGEGGRWAYTLYDGAGKTPFIHALDTRRSTARCIDLDTLAGTDLTNLRLMVGDSNHAVEVMHGSKSLLTVDRRSFAVSVSSPARSGFPWLAVLIALAALGTLGAAVLLSAVRHSGHRRSTSAAVP
jgi:hypothetical protein